MKKQKIFKVEISTKTKNHFKFVACQKKDEAIILALSDIKDSFIISSIDSIKVEFVQYTNKIINLF